MWHEACPVAEFFEKLLEMDHLLARAVASAGCRHCGGRLHRGDYQRKPRGGRLAPAGEAFTRRHSLCCGREGCRKRALPPSLRFLGRRVYLEAAVLLATAWAMVVPTAREALALTGVPVRTLRRWQVWWTEIFPTMPAWTVMRAQFVPPPPAEPDLPKSLLQWLAERSDHRGSVQVLHAAALLLAPMTTQSVPDGSRLVLTALRP
jgi:hypothetical protein